MKGAVVVDEERALAADRLGDQRLLAGVGASHITVGWNCTNSRSRRTAPARSASAMPSPVETEGLVVGEDLADAPGRARPLGRAPRRHRRAGPRPSRAASRRRRPPRPSARSRSRPSACWMTSMSGRPRRRRSGPLDLGPVASPPRARSGRGGGRPRGSARARPRRCGRTGAERDQLVHRRPALLDEGAHRVLVARPAPATSVRVGAARGGVTRPAPRRSRPGPTGSSRPPGCPW